MAMQVSEFVERIQQLPQLKTLYVKGGWGAPLNSYNKKRVINAYTYNAQRAAKINAASAETYAFDCCGIVKSVLWGFSADPTKNNGGAQYKANDVPDLSEAGFLRVCTYVSNDWSKIIPGACLFMDGHMGVYIGDGKAVESTPIWADGCQFTRVNNITAKGRGNGRTWSKWGLIPYVDYKEDEMSKEEIREIVVETMKEEIPGMIREYLKDLGKLPASWWAEGAIKRVRESKIMVGDPATKEYPEGNFRPQGLMTREEAAAIINSFLPDR